MLPESAVAPQAAVLLLGGSGPLDRDENVPKLRIDAMRQLATSLQTHGFASLRFDKRGVGRSEGNFRKTGLDDNLADAVAALNFLKALDRIDGKRVFALGHSEGASHAIRLAAAGRVAGAILLSATAMSGEACLLWQGKQVLATMRGFKRWLIDRLRLDVLKSQRKALDQIKKSTQASMRIRLVRLNAKWFREFIAYDPAEDLSRIRVPVLAITGSKDIQVNPRDLERMAALVRGDFEAHEVPDLTHLLRADPGQPGLDTYKQQVTRPVDRRVSQIVVDWLERTAVAPCTRPSHSS
jgi:pimeloyl-ACP methyl ester carboxylesterase